MSAFCTAAPVATTPRSWFCHLTPCFLSPASLPHRSLPTADRLPFATATTSWVSRTFPRSTQPRELRDSNELVWRTVRLLRAARGAGAEYVLEHPADRGAVESPIFMQRIFPRACPCPFTIAGARGRRSP
eukprot:6179602-Pleurochrysis_carterae.AAC.2